MVRGQFGGWRAFCAEPRLAPDHLMGLIPVYKMVVDLEPTARAAPCTHEVLKSFLDTETGSARHGVTAEGVLRDLREALDSL